MTAMYAMTAIAAIDTKSILVSPMFYLSPNRLRYVMTTHDCLADCSGCSSGSSGCTGSDDSSCFSSSSIWLSLSVGCSTSPLANPLAKLVVILATDLVTGSTSFPAPLVTSPSIKPNRSMIVTPRP